MSRLPLLAVACTCVVLSGCGSQKPAGKPTTTSSVSGGATGNLSFALCPKNLNNAFWRTVEQGMKAKATELGASASMVAPVEADAAKQVSMIEGVIAKGSSGIGIAPNDPDSVAGVIAEATKKGIPVITFDSDAPKSGRLCYVGTDNTAAGAAAGQAMVKELGGKGSVIIVTGGLGALNLNQRVKGFTDVVKAAGIKIIGSPMACNDDQTVADRLVEDALTANPGVSGIYCTGPWTYAAGNIIKNKGLSGKVKVVGFDTLEPELQLVKDGAIQALIGQRPREMGEKSIEILYNLSKGKKPAKEIIGTGIDVVTKANIDNFLGKN
ncbi:MAG: sugar-binding protein [Armatimonadota bacterium]